MEHPDSSRPPGEFFRAHTAEQARLLTDDAATRFLEPFLGRERSASQAARELGVPIDTLLYRVSRFLEAGLLEIVREEPRAGRPIKIYRTVADGFYVPFELTSYAEHEEQMREQLRSGEEVIVRAASRLLREIGEEGRRIYRTSDGDVWYQSAGDEGKRLEWGDYERMKQMPGPAFEAFAGELTLSDDESKEMLVTLYRLYERFERTSRENVRGERGRPFLFRFQLAADDEG